AVAEAGGGGTPVAASQAWLIGSEIGNQGLMWRAATMMMLTEQAGSVPFKKALAAFARSDSVLEIHLDEGLVSGSLSPAQFTKFALRRTSVPLERLGIVDTYHSRSVVGFRGRSLDVGRLTAISN